MEVKNYIRQLLIYTTQDTCVVLDADFAKEIVEELQDVYNITFSNLTDERLEELYQNNEILSIDKTCHGGYDKYMLTETLAPDGKTLREEVATQVFIQDDLFDCIDTNAFTGEIFPIKENECEDNISEVDEFIFETFAKLESNSNKYDILKNFYEVAFKDGRNSLAIKIHDQMYDVIENRCEE